MKCIKCAFDKEGRVCRVELVEEGKIIDHQSRPDYDMSMVKKTIVPYETLSDDEIHMLFGLIATSIEPPSTARG